MQAKLAEALTKLQNRDQNAAQNDLKKMINWTTPSLVEVAMHREQYKNMYEYSLEFVKEYDLFGE